MFSTRRLAKRSIVGTRVCAPWNDEKFYPGVIQATQTWPNGEDVYTVQFDDGRTKVCQDSEIIGPGFQTISIANLRRGQMVFITQNGRETSGKVLRHDRANDLVHIEVAPNQEPVERKLDEIRLMESRKSARLQDQDTNYSRLADLQGHTGDQSKKRTVSSVIDVPTAKQRRHRSSSSFSRDDREEEGMMLCEGDEDEGEGGRGEGGDDRQTAGSSQDDSGVMDAHMAAIVLTSLSCSPVSPAPFNTPLTDKAPGGVLGSSSSHSPGGTTGSSVGSSGVWGMMKSDPGTPSPPQYQTIVSSSAPTPGSMFEAAQQTVDEGVELEDGSYFSEDTGARKKRASIRTVFKCMWPGCGKIQNTNAAIEKHVRSAHLSPKEDSEFSDHEEEFYYQEVEVTVDTVTQTFADMYTSTSPPQLHSNPLTDNSHGYSLTGAGLTPQLKPLPDHDYQKKEPRSSPLNIPSAKLRTDSMFNPPGGASFPITTEFSTTIMSRSWQASQPTFGAVRTSRSHDRLGQSTKSHSLSTSPKNSPMHKKSRSEVKKCRKVYGMENRDLWCTQCKWKKACTRFME